MNWIYDPWPWYVSGPMISLVMFALLFMGKNFGMSANLRTMCTMCGAGNKADFFDFDWKAQRWNIMVVIGSVIGGFIAQFLLSEDASVAINPATISDLQQLGFADAGTNYLPNQLFSLDSLSDPFNLALLIIGGALVGFGARYAGGCTSGHAISGLSDLQWPSLIAVVGFFIGGLTMIHVVFPILF